MNKHEIGKQRDAEVISKLSADEILKELEESKIKNIDFSTFLNNEVKDIIKMSDEVRERITNCGSFCQFLGDLGLEHIKLEKANFCKNKFCPHCSKNKARQEAIEIATLVAYLKDKLNYNFIFLTLTAPNIEAEKVGEELSLFAKSFKRLMETKEIKRLTKGYIRKLEMTYNREQNTYHPHYHVLIAVKNNYFTDSSQYLSQKKWLKAWQKAKRDESITQVDIRKFKNQKDEFKAIFEISKYIAKDSDYMASKMVFKTFYNSLKGKRMLSYSGAFKEAVTLYKDGKLDKYLGEDLNEKIKYIYRVWYKWDNSEKIYKHEKIKDLSPEEIEILNKKKEFALDDRGFSR